MMQPQFLLCAIPAELWEAETSLPAGRQVDEAKAVLSQAAAEPLGLRDIERCPPGPLSILPALVQDALGIERRLGKNVNPDNERNRYILCCDQIESIASQFISPFSTRDEFRQAVKARRFPATTIDETYLHFLTHVMALETEQEKATEIRLGSSFFPPDEVGPHVTQFEQLARRLGWQEEGTLKTRGEFFRLAGANGCGVIEVQDPMVATAPVQPRPAAMTVASSKRSNWVASSTLGDEVIAGPRRTKMTQQLRVQIERALHAQEPVNLSNQPHDIATEVLHRFVYTVGALKPSSIRVVYADGSEGAVFPLQCLPRWSDEKLYQLTALPPLRVALISMRHLELDCVVDMAWLRNREASQSRTLSEADRFCYEYSMRQFADLERLTRNNDGVHVHLYHTGFEPAVIAFYRAFIHTLLYGHNKTRGILVVPHYYRGDNRYEHGRPWL